MASPATAAFLSGWRLYNADRMALYKLEITQPTTRTLYLAARQFVDPDGRMWEPFILPGSGPIIAPGSLLAAQIHPAHVRIIVANRKAGYQASGTFKNLLKDFYFEGAKLTIYLWETHVPSAPGYTNFATNRLQVFTGAVLNLEPGRDSIAMRAEQDIGPLLEQVPTKVVNRTNYTRSPEGSQDVPLPVIIGDFRAPVMRAPWSGRNHDYDLAGGARGTVPGILVDKGTGTAKARVNIAEHELADLTNAIPTPNDLQAVATRRARCGMFIASGQGAHPMEDPSEATLNQCKINTPIGAAGAAADIQDQFFIAHAPIPMVDVRVTGSGDITSGVADAKSALDVLDETTYARLTNVGKLVLIPAQGGALGPVVKKAVSSISVTTTLADETLTSAALFGGVTAGPVEIGDDIIDAGSPQYVLQGSVVASKTSSSSLEMDRDADDTFSGTRSMSFAAYPAEIIVGYRYSAGATVRYRARWGPSMTAIAGQTVEIPLDGSIFKIKIKDLADDATHGWDSSTWNFGDKDVIIDVSTAGAGTLDVFFVAISVRYRPSQNLVASERFNGVSVDYSKVGAQGRVAFNQFTDPGGEGRSAIARRLITPAIYELSGDFQFNTVGAADDGSGKWTGTANSLIEIASDAAYWLLQTYGLAADGDIQTATGVFGSFKGGASDARALLTTEALKIAAHLGRLTTVGRVIEQIARESGTWVYRSRFTNKFHCLVWKPSPPAQYNYDRKIRWNDILDGEMRTFRTPVTEVVNAIRVKHSFDHNHNRYLGDVNLTKTMSSNGASNAYARDAVREGIAVDSYAKFRRRETEMIQAEHLRSDAAALSLMRRTFDMRNTVLPGIAFQTTLCPDMERGRVIELDTDVDAHEPFPGAESDGSWAVKKLWVTEVHQSLEGVLETQVVAVADVDTIGDSALVYDAIPFGGIAMPV